MPAKLEWLLLLLLFIGPLCSGVAELKLRPALCTLTHKAKGQQLIENVERISFMAPYLGDWSPFFLDANRIVESAL